MENSYVITSNGIVINIDNLQHAGIKGMKWGIRRYQNKDGSLTPLGRKRYLNSDGTLNEKGVKKFGNSVKSGTETGAKTHGTTTGRTLTTQVMTKAALADMSNKELQDALNRMNNEELYKKKMNELGYVRIDKITDMDLRIADLEKQKKYIELQKEIEKLNPKKESKAIKLMGTLFDKVVEPAVTNAGKKVLEDYLTEAGTRKIKDKFKKVDEKVEAEAKKVAEKTKAQAERQAREEAEKQAKAEAKRAAKEAKKAAKKAAKDSTGKYRQSGGESTHIGITDLAIYNTPVTNLSKRTTSRGRSYVDRMRNDDYDDLVTIIDEDAPIAGYLSSPKDRGD